MEATDLAPCKVANATVYVEVKVGKHKSSTRAVGVNAGKASWKEEFAFHLSEDEAENAVLEISVFLRFESTKKELLGHAKVSVGSTFLDGKHSMPPTWFSLQPKHHDCNLGIADCGKILLTLSSVGRNNHVEGTTLDVASELKDAFSMDLLNSPKEKRSVDSPKAETLIAHGDSIKQVVDSVSNDRNPSTNASGCTFEEALEIMKSSSQCDAQESFQGDAVLEKIYVTDPKDLNSLLFRPNSKFASDLREFQGITGYVAEPWIVSMDGDLPCMKRTISYTKSSTKFVKSVKTTEEQKYVKADGRSFAIFVRVCTPEVPFGDCFEVVLLYKITPGPEIPSGEPTSKLVVSYSIEFKQTTVMKGMIEGSVRQGLKENFEGYADVLSRFVKSSESSMYPLDKEQLLAPVLAEHQSDVELAIKYFCNFTMISTVIIGLYVVAHIVLSKSDATKGLEFGGLDLPDSFSELITSGILILQMKRAFGMISHFVQARLRKGTDHHGFRTSHGDGWSLTVAVLEGINLPLFTNTLDPYLVFKCNGITKTSSVQLHTQDPQWNEVIEFDVMQEPPSVLEVELFNFHGPFDQQFSLGHAEVNFLKHTSEELADMWIPLEGKLAQACQSQLHLRVFLENNKGPETIKHYLTKMEKEVGKKLNIQSPHKNLAFQKLFGLPAEEYLIKDYSCSLKRKIPIQGRLFVSARIVGFYANIFGHKTKFFFLWEDVDDIQVVAPSLATVGSPALLLILKSGRGMDAWHGAKSQDEEGRLKFMFHSFVSFNSASRTIKALWRSKAIEHRSKLQEEQEGDEDDKSDNQSDGTESVSSCEDVSPDKAYSVELPIHFDNLMEIFSGSPLEMKIMSKVGCLDYSVTPWEMVQINSFKRQVSYKFNRYMSIFGSEVISTQLKSPSLIPNGWIITDVMSLHNVPFGDYFKVHLKYEILCLESDLSPTSQCHVYVGVEWLKKTRFKKRITRNVFDKLAHRSKEIFELAEGELTSMT